MSLGSDMGAICLGCGVHHAAVGYGQVVITSGHPEPIFWPPFRDSADSNLRGFCIRAEVAIFETSSSSIQGVRVFRADGC